MPQLITIIVVLGALALIVARIRSGRIHLRVAEWPMSQQIEAGLAVLFALFAGLGAFAGEYGFATWLGLMAVVLTLFVLRSR